MAGLNTITGTASVMSVSEKTSDKGVVTSFLLRANKKKDGGDHWVNLKLNAVHFGTAPLGISKGDDINFSAELESDGYWVAINVPADLLAKTPAEAVKFAKGKLEEAYKMLIAPAVGGRSPAKPLGPVKLNLTSVTKVQKAGTSNPVPAGVAVAETFESGLDAFA